MTRLPPAMRELGDGDTGRPARREVALEVRRARVDREGEHGVDELAERAPFCAYAEALAPRRVPGLIVLHVVHDCV
jgi:hypothetical protein